MTHVEITDITGAKWIGDQSEKPITADERDRLGDMLSNFSKLEYLTIEIDDAKYYFNPAHVISVSIHGGVE